MMMIRLGWKGFPILGTVALAVGAAFGEVGIGVGFALVGVAAIAALLQGPRHHGAAHAEVWQLFAVALLLFLVGGVADVLTATDTPSTPLKYPGWREPFDLAAYLTLLGALWMMGRARQVHRDRTITLDALVTVLGVGSLAWALIMTEYLESSQLTTAGKATGVTFSVVTLMLGFATIRLAIGSGSRPPAYYLLAGAAVGGFGAELLVEIELVGWSPFGGSDVLSAGASATAFMLIATAALHPSMRELTQPPVDPTPAVTGRRLALMTCAVLIPPGLLLVDQSRQGRLSAAILIGLWALISLMVMGRIASLALAREEAARWDRVVATAEARLATAATDEEKVSTVVDAVSSLVASASSVGLYEQSDDGWVAVARSGEARAPAGPDVPAVAGFAAVSQRGDTWQLAVRADVAGRQPFVLVAHADTEPSAVACAHTAALVADLGRVMEADLLRDLMARNKFERRFKILVENSADIIFVLDGAGAIQFVSPTGPRLLGSTEAALMGAHLADLIEGDDPHAVRQLLAGEQPRPVQLQLRTADGGLLWFEARTADLTDEPVIGGIVVTASEISAQKKAELDLRRSEARFRSLVRHASDLVVVLDSDGLISWISPSVTSLLGFSPDELADREFSHLVYDGDRRAFHNSLCQPEGAEIASTVFEVRLRDDSNEWRTLEARLTDLRDDPNVEAVVLNAHDITERKKLEETLRHQVVHDHLTGIPNRILLHDRIEHAMQASDDTDVAVIVLDLDDFKAVNDGLGHAVGDHVLKIVAFRLEQHLRATDTAARLSGDEFAVLLSGKPSRRTALSICHRLLAIVEEPIEIEGRGIVLRASAGVAFASDLEAPTPDTLLRSADVAMYGAKNRGKSRVSIFDTSMHEGAFQRLELKADLAQALERDELTLHYQPLVDLASGAITGFEALMRWQHPDRGLVSPATFIPLAEETGLIVPIGRWLFHTAFAQLKSWQSIDGAAEDLSMSINVSGRQLEDDDLIDDLTAALAESGVDASTVVVELTESIAVEDSPLLVERLSAVRALGVGLHADDFGSGFASYAALQSLPFTGVKLDRSLIAGLEGATTDRAEAQIRSIIDMAANTSMHVVAEGIESAAQVQTLRTMQCGTAQGFYFARPAPPETAVEVLRTNREDSRLTPHHHLVAV